jgi:hypothetical protein
MIHVDDDDDAPLRASMSHNCKQHLNVVITARVGMPLNLFLVKFSNLSMDWRVIVYIDCGCSSGSFLLTHYDITVRVPYVKKNKKNGFSAPMHRFANRPPSEGGGQGLVLATVSTSTYGHPHAGRARGHSELQ